MTRKRLLTMGERGNLVRLVRDTEREKPFLVIVGTARKQFAFDTRPLAEKFITDRSWERSTLTNQELWDRFAAEESRGLAPSTVVSYDKGWRRWMKYSGGPKAVVEEIDAKTIHGFARALEKKGLSAPLAAATVRTTLGAVRAVFGWGRRVELLTDNPWRDYRHKTSAERRTKQRAEYRESDFPKIWGALNPTDDTQWRAWVVVGLLAIYGARPGEILQLRWSWITDDAIVLPAAITKTREERTLPLMPATRAILAVARKWRDNEHAFVLPGRDGAHYQLRDFNRGLRGAEDRAGVPHILFRSGHAFRRGAVGDLADETGDVSLALLAVGDKNLSMAKHYRVRREDTTTAPIERRAMRLVDADEIAKVAAGIRNEPAMSVLPGDGANPASPSTEES